MAVTGVSLDFFFRALLRDYCIRFENVCSLVFVFFSYNEALHAQLIMFMHFLSHSSCGIDIIIGVAVLDGDPYFIIVRIFQQLISKPRVI